jgi:hypothetical protein
VVLILFINGKPDTSLSGFWTLIVDLKYSEPPNTGPSGFQMVILRTLLVSGFQEPWWPSGLIRTIRTYIRSFTTSRVRARIARGDRIDSFSFSSFVRSFHFEPR